LSTLALEGSRPVGAAGRLAVAARHADLLLLALALPVFLVAGWPLLGYATAAGAWLGATGIQVLSERRASTVLRRGERRAALGTIAAATLARVWLVTLAILLTGLLAEREDGLAAAVLAAALVTVHLIAMALTRALTGEAS
jgi:hypothetical protein